MAVSKRTLQANLECGLQTFKSLHEATLERFLTSENIIAGQVEEIGKLLQTTILANVVQSRTETMKAMGAK